MARKPSFAAVSRSARSRRHTAANAAGSHSPPANAREFHEVIERMLRTLMQWKMAVCQDEHDPPSVRQIRQRARDSAIAQADATINELHARFVLGQERFLPLFQEVHGPHAPSFGTLTDTSYAAIVARQFAVLGCCVIDLGCAVRPQLIINGPAVNPEPHPISAKLLRKNWGALCALLSRELDHDWVRMGNHLRNEWATVARSCPDRGGNGLPKLRSDAKRGGRPQSRKAKIEFVKKYREEAPEASLWQMAKAWNSKHPTEKTTAAALESALRRERQSSRRPH